MQASETELYDNLFTFWVYSQYEFYGLGQVQTSATKLSTVTNKVASIRVQLDQRRVFYGRVAETFFKGLESVGGFSESVRYIGLLLVCYF